MDSNVIYITAENGEEIAMEVLFTFDSDEFKKSYVLFHNPNDKEGTVYTMSYDEAGNLYEVETDAEWEMIEEVFATFQEEE